MTPDQALKYVNRRFVYQTDKEQYGFSDVWRIMKPENMKGDCEDFSLTVLWLLVNKKPSRMIWWLFTRKAKIHFYTHKTQINHAGLEYGGAYVDNITREWNDGSSLAKRGYRKRFAFPFTFMVLKTLVSIPFWRKQ
jgi:Bacterial transglutaminase-like cysteine proteinase BTLCP